MFNITYAGVAIVVSVSQCRVGRYSAFACSGSCPVPGHVILTCKLHISGKI